MAKLIVTALAALALQTPPAQSITVAGRSIALVAPDPFVEVSRVFPDGFKLRQETLPATNRLLAWFIPSSAVKDRLNRLAPSYRTLQVQVLTAMATGSYGESDIAALTREIRKEAGDAANIVKREFDQVLKKPKFEELGLEAGMQRFLGVLEEGRDFATIGMVIYAKGQGREVSSALTLSCYFLVRDKILLLVVSGREASAAELAATEGILGEWRALLRSTNSVR